MRAMPLTLGAAVMLMGLAFTLPNAEASTGPIPLNCNRACLEGLVNQYLTAVAAHNPSGLPLSKDVVYTENNQVLDLGDGYWKTAEGRGNYSHYFADPEGGQVAYILSNGKAFEFTGFNRPSSILVTEASLIENNKIRRVESGN